MIYKTKNRRTDTSYSNMKKLLNNKLKTCEICLFFLLIYLVQACTTNTRPETGTANITINITLSVDASSFEQVWVRLSNYQNGKHFDKEWISPSNSVIIHNVKYGIYTLTLLLWYDREYIIAENIHIDTRKVTLEAFIDLEKIDHKIITIKNNTGNPIHSVIAGGYRSLRWGNMTNIISTVFYDSHDIISFGNSPSNLINVRLIDIHRNIFTKFAFCMVQNDEIVFTIDDLDGNDIKDFGELVNIDRFDLTVYINSFIHEDIVITSRTDFSEISLKINGKNIELFPNEINFRRFMGKYDFIPGETYHFEITTINPDMKESVYFTVGQKMIVGFPLTIDETQIDLSWRFEPHDNQNPDFLNLTIGSRDIMGFMRVFEQNLQTCSRYHSVPIGVICSPETGSTDIVFRKTYYAISGRVSFIEFNNISAHYIQGRLMNIQSEITLKFLENENIEKNLVGG